MLDLVTSLLNGDHGEQILWGVRAAVLLSLAWFAWRVLLTAAPSGSGRGFRLLAWSTAVALVALLINQGSWQLAGFQRSAFMQFLRSHNPRPDSPDKQVRRGRILDWRGAVLAEPAVDVPWTRHYPLGPAAAHAVGYVHPVYGWSGVERAADALLSGYGFTNLRELDRLGRNLLESRQPEGNDVTLNLDARLQRRAWDLMAGRAGAVVVMRPADGAIRVLLSSPAFDPHNPGAGLDDADRAAMLNRATQGLYPPGSTFKVLMALLAADQGRAPILACPAEGFSAEPGAKPIRDSEYTSWHRDGRIWRGWGRIGLADGFAHSSNVYFAQLGLACGAEPFGRLVSAAAVTERVAFFDGRSGTMSSAAGQVPVVTDADRRVLAQLAIGQGRLLVTPLHVALFTAIIANQGVLPQPQLRAGVPPAALRRVASTHAAATVRDLMREAVLRGTGRGADIAGLEVCGKTGTAEATGGDDHAWFTCFAPARRPALVVTVLVERGGYGSRAAVPVARGLLETAAKLGLLAEKPAEGRAADAAPSARRSP